MATYKDLTGGSLTKTFRKELAFDYTKADDKSTDPDVAGEIEGYAAGLLNIDKGEDLIFPGFFEGTKTEEVVVAYQHDITAILGRPLELEERTAPDYGLWTRSEIIATSLGSDVMKLVRKKILRKMSIGYRLKEGGFSMLNRDALVGTLKDFNHRGEGIPLPKQEEIVADFDKRKLSGVFGLFKGLLREYSIVTFPMNDNASITGAKAGEWGEMLDSLPFSLHPHLVLAANKGYVERATALFKELREPKGRGLGDAHREALEIIAGEGAAVAKEAQELLQALGAVKSGTLSKEEEAALVLQAESLILEIDARTSGALPPGTY